MQELQEEECKISLLLFDCAIIQAHADDHKEHEHHEQ